MKKGCLTALLMAVLAAVNVHSLVTAQTFHIGRGAVMFQVSADEVVPVSNEQIGENDWIFESGLQLNGVPEGNVILYGSYFTTGLIMPMFEDNQTEYQVEVGFDTRQELEVYAAPGSYQCTWQAPGGGYQSEFLDLGVFAPLQPKRITNYDALQNIDPWEPFTISWEPFTDVGEKEGFIEVELSSTGGWDQVVWSSDDEIEEGFGLDPATTSVEVPAGVLLGNPSGHYDVYVYFARIDEIDELPGDPPGIRGVVTTTETRAHVRTIEATPGRLVLHPAEWMYHHHYGYVYGYTANWGYSHNFRWIYTGFTPGYLYQYKLGWLIPTEGNINDGMWYYCLDHGWIFVAEEFGPYYKDLQNNWGDMLMD